MKTLTDGSPDANREYVVTVAILQKVVSQLLVEFGAIQQQT
jgi:hypothetical protein